MKKILLSMFLLGTLLSANAQVPSYVPSNGLVGWWPFSGSAMDSSGNGNNGAVNGASLTTDRFGKNNRAYSYNGVNNYIQLNNSTTLDYNNDFTISLWVSTLSITKPFQFLVSKDTMGAPLNGDWDFLIRQNKIEFDIVKNNTFYSLSSNAINTNIWNNALVTRNSKTGLVKLYMNGQLVDSLTTFIGLILNKQPMVFGKQGSSNLHFLNGVLDDIGIWNRALTASEIKDLYYGCKIFVSTEPTNQSSNINAQSQFIVTLNDTTASYQWQSNQSSLGWVNVPANSIYSGTTSKKLTVSNIQVNNHKQLFRVIATKNTCKDTSIVAMLTVNDTCITSTTDTLYIKVNTSSLSNPVYNTVKVYPNPSSTQVIIDNGNYSTMGSYTAKIVNSIGQQVFQSVINQQQFVIDAKTMGGAGVYTLYITDANNKVVGVKKIVLQ